MTDAHELDAGTEGADTELLIFADEFGLLVQGPEDAASAAIDRLLDGSDPGPGPRRRLSTSDAAAIGASGVALAATSGEYLRLTAASAAKVKEFGPQFDATGAMRGWVRDGHQFAGQLTFEPVSLAAEQALALQSAAVSLALRSAIANVQKAVERVEGKVDKINRHLESRLRGDVIGTYRHLQQIVEATSLRGHLLQADWDSVSGVRHQLARDLESMREYVRLEVGDFSRDLSVPKREDKLKRFHQETGNVADVMTLILVAEQSLHLYEYLRLQQVRRSEPDFVSSAVSDARAFLHKQRELDQKLVSELRSALELARTIDPLEIHHVLSKKGLDKHSRLMDQRLREFVDATALTPLPTLPGMVEPRLSDTGQELRERAEVAGRATRELSSSAAKSSAKAARKGGKQIKDSVKKARRR